MRQAHKTGENGDFSDVLPLLYVIDLHISIG
jgi:hypothetical protein